ncbi:Prefoldin [Glarea lozoyensis ATCC 20868]|uniref:Prefoldin n=1 Tax=Glarea lozoyensis (strain ATCC 20868 / MF5171) TaxID=1116229 RepID=S3CIG4_GLAL2|nr:Prefoldin [Glarea lozoyensis ATCC 20868]EPE25054.1 Prefoldin [Glarea lozoyensis ATCC 20868]
MAEVQQQLQALSAEYQAVQQGTLMRRHGSEHKNLIFCAELQNHVNSRQKLESQQQENRAVQKEFSGLADDAKIYKLVGPVLLKQEKTEAVLAVDGRLDYIVNEIKRVEKQIKDTEDKSDAVRSKIIQVQSQAQPQDQGSQAQVAA